MSNPALNPDLLTLDEASSYLKTTTTKWTIHNLLRKRGQGNELPFLKLGRRLYFRRCDLDAYLNALVQR